jgi:hypothetical protein
MAEKIKLTLYHADWCGHCIRFIPVWNEFLKYVDSHKLTNANGKPVKIEHVSYQHTRNMQDKKDNAVIEKNGIRSFPTIIVEADKKYEYSGPRSSVQDILTHLKLKTAQNGGGGKDYHNYLKYKSKYLAIKNK